jgi:haloalkane dehalogenase
MNGFVHAGLLRATSDRSRFKNGVGKGYLAPYDSWDNRVAHLRFVEDIPLEDGHPSRPLFLQIGEEVRTFADRPSLIVWGERDFCFVPHYRAGWVERLPNAEVHVLEHAAHWVVEDAHEEIVPILRRFLEAHALQEGAS